MAVKKSELYSSLWSSCDELRGGMDAGQYKDYVLAMLFIKYVSDKYAGVPFAQIKVPAGASFKDMIALKGTSDIGDQINKKIIAPLEQANNLSFGGVDFNDATKLGSGKELVGTLTNLIAIFENPALDFSKNRAEGDDLLGDAYEFLMRHFATESGKSKGQFYTPAEVSRVIAQVLGIRYADTTNKTTVYDPTCGSGSLLLKVGDEASHGKEVRVTLYGQEKDNATAGLARMNMILHDYATAEIKQGNTLTTPLFKNGEVLETFDYVVANPPFSDKRWSTGLDAEKDEYERFQHYGVPPKKQGDYAYLLHILRSMKPGGKGACILPHGVLFRGGAEGAIRRNLIQYGYIKGIIGLPANLFYGTGIPACIIVLDKEGASARKGIFMIDASKGFRKDGPKNRLREQDIHKIVDTFLKQAELSRYSRLVPVTEISDQRNDYNLNLPRYIDSTEPEDLQDIDGHLRGGIPQRDIDALHSYWDVIPGVRRTVFKDFNRPGYYQLTVPITEVKSAIFSHDEFTTFNDSVSKLLAKWKKKNTPLLKGFSKDGRPKVLIETIAEDLLATFRGAPLLDEYDIYQHLMDYWAQTMQDDCYLIAGDGWREAAQPRLIIEDKSKKNKTKPDFVVGKKKYQTELVPPALIIRRWFADEQHAIERLEFDVAAIQQEIEMMAEEHGGEEGLLADAKNDKDKLTKASVMARLKELKDDPDSDEERNKLYDYLAVTERETDTSEKLVEAQEELVGKVAAKYAKLTEDEIKTLVVDDKWLRTLRAAVQDELNRVSQTLTGRVCQLAERYAVPLQALVDLVAALATRVGEHFKNVANTNKRDRRQFLTGKSRLPGFEGRWQAKQLADLVDFTNGKPHEGHVDPTGRYSLITLDSIGIDGRLKSEHRTVGVWDNSLAKDDIVIILSDLAHGNLLGLCDLIPEDGKYVLNQRVGRLRVKPEVKAIPQFLRLQINRRQDHFKMRGQGTSQRHIYRRDIDQLEIELPEPDEQSAIADVMSDIDAEFAMLGQWRDKTRDLKEAMMQELLTEEFE